MNQKATRKITPAAVRLLALDAVRGAVIGTLMLYSVPFVLAWILMLFGLTPSLPSHNFPAGMLWSSSSHWLLAG